MPLSTKQTPEKKKKIIYSDFPINFELHPLTGDIAKVTNEEAVKESVKNIVLTSYYERPYQPLFGSQLAGFMFENFSPQLVGLIESSIKQSLEDNEPRIGNIFVEVHDDVDNNGLNCSVVFTVINTSARVSLDLPLKRVR